MATIVNVQDPSTSNNLAVDSSGRIGVNNFPSVQTIQGTVNVALFPSVQTVSGAVDVTDRSLRQLGIVTVANGGIGTNTAPAYTIIQDPTSNAHKMAINADGSINVSGSITASNPSVGTDGSAIPTSSTLIGASDGTNLQQLLVESSSNRNLRVGLYSGANETTVTGSNALKVDNSAVTQPVSAASLPLPAGASTAAKQPALGTAGTASADVITIQGIASMTAVKVDGSGVTQPVSGTITANAGTGSFTVAQTTAANLNATATIQLVTGTAIVVGNNAVPVLNTAATGYVAAYGSNPAALTANTDAAFKWGAGGTTLVNHLMVQNNTAINVLWDLDTATSAGSPILTPGQTIFLDVQTTALHLQTNGTPNLNGTSANNIVVRTWL